MSEQVRKCDDTWDIDVMNTIIDLKTKQTDTILKEVEDNFIDTIKSRITYHAHLMREALQHRDGQAYGHHLVMHQTYKAILTNYESSRRYSTT